VVVAVVLHMQAIQAAAVLVDLAVVVLEKVDQEAVTALQTQVVAVVEQP
jgi:hypothetical protein